MHKNSVNLTKAKKSAVYTLKIEHQNNKNSIPYIFAGDTGMGRGIM